MVEGLLRKGISQSIEHVDEGKGIVTGYFSSFDTLDSDGDVITKGAYTKTIAESGPTGKNRIKHLFNHDSNMIVAKILELKEDSYGLWYKSQAGSHTLGQDWLKMVKDELITEHSIGFKVIKSHKGEHTSGNVQFLTELQVWEGSSVTWGANPYTPVMSKSIEASIEELGDLMYRLEKAVSNGTYSDDTLIHLENQVKELRETIANRLVKQTTLPGGVQTTDTTKPDESKEEAEMEIVRTFKMAVKNG